MKSSTRLLFFAGASLLGCFAVAGEPIQVADCSRELPADVTLVVAAAKQQVAEIFAKSVADGFIWNGCGDPPVADPRIIIVERLPKGVHQRGARGGFMSDGTIFIGYAEVLSFAKKRKLLPAKALELAIVDKIGSYLIGVSRIKSNVGLNFLEDDRPRK
jgi:hypothetical protein